MTSKDLEIFIKQQSDQESDRPEPGQEQEKELLIRWLGETVFKLKQAQIKLSPELVTEAIQKRLGGTGLGESVSVDLTDNFFDYYDPNLYFASPKIGFKIETHHQHFRVVVGRVSQR